MKVEHFSSPIKSYKLRTVFVWIAVISLVSSVAFIFAVTAYVSGLHPSGTMVSIEYSIRVAFLYTVFGVWLLFGGFYIALHYKVIEPIANLAKSFRSFTEMRDWENRVPSVVRISELDSLVSDFNQMVGVVQIEHTRLLEISTHDVLTGLLNRRGFDACLNEEFARAKRFNIPFSLILIDMDNFKFINDTYGHSAGDHVLRTMAARLSVVLREVDAFARIGGDEFIVLLPRTKPENGLSVAHKLHNTLNAASFAVADANNEEVQLAVTASIGVACYPRDGYNSLSIYQAVDEVLYKAKRAGKNCVVSLDACVDDAIQSLPLRQSVEEGRIEVALQPIVNVKNGSVFAYEALARINIDGELRAAECFIEAAEAAGLTKAIDASVFRKGLELMRQHDVTTRIFFNFSAVSFLDREWMLSLPAVIRAAGVECRRVVIEITERESLPNIEDVKNIIADLRVHDIRFALDDFGTGFSSLLYIQHLHVDYIKIDGSFISNIAACPRDRFIVENIQLLAQSFGMITIAEFVQDVSTVAILKEIGIHLAQGYHFGNPEMAGCSVVAY